MELIKAVPLGGALAGITSLFLGSGGARAGLLNVQMLHVNPDIGFYWSWPIFAMGTALAWGLLALQK